MLNDPNQPSETRRPRSIVQIGGTTFRADGSPDVTSLPVPMTGWIEWEVENNVFSEADRFSVSFAISGLPDDRREDWFAQQQEISVEIFAGFPADPASFDSSQLQSLIYGMADELDFDPVSRTLHLSGRDLTARMIDSKCNQVWVNRRTSDVANDLATKYGLNAKVTPTLALMGKYYEKITANLQHQRSDWDVLSCLAKNEQCAVWVAGHDLHLEPAPDEITAEPYVLQWQNNPFAYNGASLTFSRSLTLSRGVQVTVKSFHQGRGGFSRQYPATAASNALQYSYTLANLTSEQAYQHAQVLYGELTQHEVKLSASMPADNQLTTANVIQVTGTGTAYDQKYYPDSVIRRMSLDGGYTMSVSAKNRSPQMEALAL